MSGSPWGRIRSVLLAVLLGLTGLVGLSFLAPNAQAATWTQDTDVDFGAGTLSGVEIVGTGTPAVVQLIQDATDWKNEAPLTNPGAREGPALAYDSTNSVAVLFGGYNAGNFGDTWEYTPSTNSWVQTSVTGPSARAYSGMAFDSANARIVLFGGVSDIDAEADTWEYNAATDAWVNTTPASSPPKMGSNPLAYDSSAVRVILVGQSIVTGLMETWAYDTSADTWQNRIATFVPPRSGQGLAYFAAQSRTVLYGGSVFTFYGDTWEYDYAANSWTNTVADGSGPPGRTSMGLSYRSTDSAVWMFGGNTGSPVAQTWRYFDVGGTRVWTNVPTQRNPPPRYLLGMTDEAAASGKSFVYGGVLAGGAPASDTWSLGPAYRSSGFFTSQTFDSGGANVNWNTFSWAPTSQPAGTVLRFQIAASNDPAGPWDYRGPDCAGNTYYTTSGTAICASQDAMRYLRVQANLLSSDNLFTATLDSFTVDYTVAASDPYIILTSPDLGGNPQTVPIFIRFSEEMVNGTVTWTIDPPISVGSGWSESNSALTLTPSPPLAECTAYTVTITAGTDVDGNNLNNTLNTDNNPFSFGTQCINPTITATDPPQGMMDVPLNATVIVDFSEQMNTTSVSWTIVPAIASTGAWSIGDTRLTISHVADFPQCTMHTVNVSGKDLAGLPLLPGAAPNPFEFHTVCTTPFIVTTVPAHLATGVSGSADVVVTFSEPMQPLTVTWTSTPATTFTSAWSGGDTVLTLSHVVPWPDCTIVTMNITGGKDLDGNDLFPGQHEFHAQNPWKFAVTCLSPFIVVTIPPDGATGVGQFDNITVQFSEPMNNATVTFSINPSIPLTPSWNPQNQFLTLSHVLPFSCGPNVVTITGGQDVDGNGLVPGFVPNPWTLSPTCPDPFITMTNPTDGVAGVSLTADIVVTFSEAMNTTTVVFDIVPPIATTGVWSGGNTILTLSHAAPFNQSTEYAAAITAGRDLDGNGLVPGPAPNPWRFTTVGLNPFIVTTDPVDGATNVGVSSNVIVTFSEAMNPGSVTATPSPGILLSHSWSVGDTVLTLSHILPFAECTVYTFTIAGNDTQGDPLVAGPVPNPFDFTTACLAPFIIATSPFDGAVNIALNAPIVVDFSEPMDTATVSAVLVPPAGALTYTWSNGNQTVTITHSTDFIECTNYQVTVSGADPDGSTLIGGPVPNPWTFSTFCALPFIVSTVPADGATNVAATQLVIVTFSRAMNTTGGATFVTFTPTVANLAYVWSGGDTVMTVTHDPFVDCTNYQATVTGMDTNGNALVAGPAPNPWTFSTVCTVAPPGGLQVTRVAPSTIRLSWTASPGADQYRVHESANRFAAWPWAVLGSTATTSFDAAGHLTDGLTHFYIVRAWRGTTESTNSTMGVKIARAFGFSAGGSNIHWFSLPYRSPYARASDIANELTNTRVSVIAKWNPATQSSILYYWFRGSWRGTDFTINAGDGLYVGSVSAFSWAIVGTDRGVTLSFIRNAPPLGNVNWISLPYTSTYGSASDLVIDIEGSTGPGANTKIVEVVKWDSVTQTQIRYFWTGGGWTGTNFSLAPGDAVYFLIVANFSWQPRLVTPEVP